MIDFGVAGLGDPACDIAVQLGSYGDGVVQRMATHHPRLLDVIDRARFWAGTFELQWVTAGLEHDDVSLLLAHIGGTGTWDRSAADAQREVSDHAGMPPARQPVSARATTPGPQWGLLRPIDAPLGLRGVSVEARELSPEVTHAFDGFVLAQASSTRPSRQQQPSGGCHGLALRG